MSAYETLTARNAGSVVSGFDSGLRIVPVLKAIVIGCVDPRVDPADVLSAAPGDIAVIRNVGGRITPAVLLELAMLRKVTQSAGGDLGPGWDLIVLQHTDCGITRIADETEMLADFFGAAGDDLAARAVSDPIAAVRFDVAVLQAALSGPRVSGLVYDVDTGLLETVVPPSQT